MKTKNLLIIALVAIFSLSITAQTVIYSPGKTVYGSMDANSFAKIDLLIFNNTSDSLDVGWKLISNNLVSGWDYSLCDFGTCYTGIPANGKMKKMGTNDTAFLKINLSPLNISGTGIVVFELAPKLGEKDTITFNIDAFPLSVYDNPLKPKFTISPNPASDYIAVDFTKTNSAKSNITITNILGEIVKQENLLSEKRTVFSTSDLQEGIYFLTLQSGQTTETKKIVISR